MEEVFHAPFNAALLHATALAYPEAAISFRGFPVHLDVVRGIIAQYAPALVERIEWRVATLRPTSSLLVRWMRSARLLRQALAPDERVLFTSISRMQLLQLKRMMRKRDSVRVVLHGNLEELEIASRERFPLNLFSLKRVVMRPHPLGLRYIVLGQSIAENLPQRFRPALGIPCIIDHPYHFFPVRPAPAQPPIFGVFGNTGDGRLLEEVARAVKAVDPTIRFRLIGFLSDQAAVERLRPLIEDVGCEPICRESFIERAQSITHSLWLGTPGCFRLRASGTFFDALAYCKPLVYTANAYIDFYCAREPAIAVCCATLDAVPAAILDLAVHSSSESYAAAVQAIQRLRIQFAPEEQAKRLPSELGWQ
jgi:hypothetical protein